MILIHTHVWIWWIQGDERLTKNQIDFIEGHELSGICISKISVWEVAKLVQKSQVKFSVSLKEWLEIALSFPGIEVIELSNEIIVESIQLPGNFHKDPADQIIAATSRILDTPLLTFDRKIIEYPHVQTI